MPYIQYETLFELYIQKQWTQKAIADALNCSVHRVRQSIHHYQLPIHPLLKRLLMTEEELKAHLNHLYLEKGFTIHQIAKQWQVSRGAIQRSLAKYGITRRKSRPISKQVLKELYLDQSLPVSEIAQQFDCQNSQIYTLIHRYDLPARKPVMGLRKKLRMNDDELTAYLHHLYWNQKTDHATDRQEVGSIQPSHLETLQTAWDTNQRSER